MDNLRSYKLILPWHTAILRLEWLKLQGTKDTERWWGEVASRTCRHCWYNCEMAQPSWKTVWKFLLTLNNHLLNIPAILLPGVWLRETKSYVSRKICTKVFIAALLITVNKWKLLKYYMYTQGNEWVGKFCPIRSIQ